jgi:hypothetical protein
MKETLKDVNGNEIRITGNNHKIKIEYDIPPWADDNDEIESCFSYKGFTYFLSEFIKTGNKGLLSEYDAIYNSNAFSGVLIKLADNGDSVQAYSFMS